ncbi:hypothetical protein, partial [Streptomyces turgidiscabies]|uniref:hypothetical protein n=1 Tax=Streptomyces turgidiscabies TaxID=85558 RepID=UPI0038F7F028
MRSKLRGRELVAFETAYISKRIGRLARVRPEIRRRQTARCRAAAHIVESGDNAPPKVRQV